MGKSYKNHRSEFDDDYYSETRDKRNEKLIRRRADKLLKNSRREQTFEDYNSVEDEDL